MDKKISKVKVPCPECGKEFFKPGLGPHMARIHGIVSQTVGAIRFRERRHKKKKSQWKRASAAVKQHGIPVAQTVVEAPPLLPPAQPKRKRGRPPGKRWVGNVERELLAVTGQLAKGEQEDYQTYQKRLIDAAEQMKDSNWHQLSYATQQWTNDQIGALENKPAVQIPSFPRVPLSKRITTLEPVKLSPPAPQRRGRKPKVKPPLLVESVSGAARQLREKALELRAIADTLMRKADLLEN